MKLHWKAIQFSHDNEEICIDERTGRIVGGVSRNSAQHGYDAHCHLKTEGGYTIGEYVTLAQAKAAVELAVAKHSPKPKRRIRKEEARVAKEKGISRKSFRDHLNAVHSQAQHQHGRYRQTKDNTGITCIFRIGKSSRWTFLNT